MSTTSDFTPSAAQRARSRLRMIAERVLDRDLMQVERARRALLHGSVDVLFLGDSTAVLGSPDDADPTPLPGLVARSMGGARVVGVCAAGLGPAWYAEVVRLLGTLAVRPSAVVVTVGVRTWTSTHVRRHPVFAREGSLRALARHDDARRPVLPLRRGEDRANARAYAAFEALPVMTRWGSEHTIGAFRRRLKGLGPHPWPLSEERLLFDYFHGEAAASATSHLADAARFADQLARYDVPAVCLFSEVPRERGEQIFPGEFNAWVDGNQGRLADALRSPVTRFVRPAVPDEEFVDPLDGTEHYSLAGRLRVARAVAERIATHAGG